MKALSQCRVIDIVDDEHLILFFNHQQIRVEHFYFNGHIAAVLSHPSVQWIVQNDLRQEKLFSETAQRRDDRKNIE